MGNDEGKKRIFETTKQMEMNKDTISQYLYDQYTKEYSGVKERDKPEYKKWLKQKLFEAETKVSKSDFLPCVSARTEMRKQAITVFELTKGFTGEPTDNAMKTALEMAAYVMRLTNDL